MLALIFANGVLDGSRHLPPLLEQADLLIAADGGARYCVSEGIIPDILLGDFDSIEASVLAAFKKSNVEIHRHPERKDATDLELALDLAVDRAADAVWLIGALGNRWDMSLVNILLAASDKYKDIRVSLLAEDCSMHILHPGPPRAIRGNPGERVSLLALKDDVCGVTLKGFEYPLTCQSISFGSSLGISNVLRSSSATVQLSEGVLLCIRQLTD
jgi:thiamine pyrophosphokinase